MDKDASKAGKDRTSAAEDPASTSKRAALIFLASLGVALLVTGATGARMLRNSATSAASPATAKTNKRPTSRLKDLLTSSSAPVSIDFCANRTLHSLPPLHAAGLASMSSAQEGRSPDQINSPALDATLDAVKALGIATAMIIGGTGFTAFWIAKKVGAHDVWLPVKLQVYH